MFSHCFLFTCQSLSWLVCQNRCLFLRCFPPRRPQKLISVAAQRAARRFSSMFVRKRVNRQADLFHSHLSFSRIVSQRSLQSVGQLPQLCVFSNVNLFNCCQCYKCFDEHIRTQKLCKYRKKLCLKVSHSANLNTIPLFPLSNLLLLLSSLLVLPLTRHCSTSVGPHIDFSGAKLPPLAKPPGLIWDLG